MPTSEKLMLGFILVFVTVFVVAICQPILGWVASLLVP